MVSVADRRGPVFAEYWYPTTAGPVPDALVVTVNQFASDETVHPHAGPVVKVTVPDPWPGPTEDGGAEREYVQGAAAWSVAWM